jgi:hypothetical protein
VGSVATHQPKPVKIAQYLFLSAIELATKKVPRHNSRMSLVQSGGILFYCGV